MLYAESCLSGRAYIGEVHAEMSQLQVYVLNECFKQKFRDLVRPCLVHLILTLLKQSRREQLGGSVPDGIIYIFQIKFILIIYVS